MKKQNILKLEKRGCDFWKDCNERKVSDLENFRLFGYLVSNGTKYYVEITTHQFGGKLIPDFVKKNNIDFVSSHIDNGYEKKASYKKNGVDVVYTQEFRDLKKVTSAKPTKKDVIAEINKTFNTKFTDIEIVENL